MDRFNMSRCAPPSTPCSERGSTIVELAVALLMSSVVIVGLAIALLESKNQLERDLLLEAIERNRSTAVDLRHATGVDLLSDPVTLMDGCHGRNLQPNAARKRTRGSAGVVCSIANR